jgi:2-amino-4-hydroxy-6-hydroxymethyldihydropteridine diphosphokinase
MTRSGESDVPKEVTAYLALGSNLGDRLLNMQHASERIGSHPYIQVVAASRLYETAPMGPPQGRFLNAAISIRTTLSPHAVLAICRQTESSGGRKRGTHWGPRTIDVDILDYDGAVVNDADLSLPHPGIADRLFVLAPLQDIAPQWRHPVTDSTVNDMYNQSVRVSPDSIVVVASPSWCGWVVDPNGNI